MAETIYRKYRPMSFKDVVGQAHVTQTLGNQIEADNVAHAYLFTGPRGVGKTTTARLLAKAVNCEKRKGAEPCGKCESCKEITAGNSLDVFEIDAASNTGVDNVRENIIESVRFAPNKHKFKVYVIDEVHMLSTSAFNALLKTLEEPPTHAIFILATTEIHKVPETIISRCQRFDFRRVAADEIIKRMKGIIKKEEVEVADEVLSEIARRSEGCLRDAESLLGQILALGEKKIGTDEASLVLPSTGTALVVDFIKTLGEKDAAAGIKMINTFVEEGVRLGNFTDEVVSTLRAILFGKLGGLEQFTKEFDKDTAKELSKLTEAFSAAELLRAINVLLEARRALARERIPQLPLELAVVELCGRNDTRQGVGEDNLPTITPNKPKNDPKVKLQGEDLEVEKDPTSPRLRGTGKGQSIKEQEDESTKSEVKNLKSAPPAEDMAGFRHEGVGGKERETESLPSGNLSLDQVKKKWQDVFNKVAAQNASLPLVLQSAEILEMVGDCVRLGFQFEFHAQMINEGKNKVLIENSAAEVFGCKVVVEGVHRADERDEVVSDIMNEFGGQEVGA